MSIWNRLACTLRKPEFKVGVAFWLFGLCNNFAYVIMLSAANDILKSLSNNNTDLSTVAPPVNTSVYDSSHHRDLDCNIIGTGAILLADILPALIVKVTAPGYVQKMNFRVKVILVSVLALVSFIVVGFSQAVWVSLLGVVAASVSSGLGEITFLSLTASYEESSLSGWSSGTGGAGVFGSLSYLGLTMVLSPRTTIFIMCIVPIILLFDYFVLLPNTRQTRAEEGSYEPLLRDQSGIPDREVDSSTELINERPPSTESFAPAEQVEPGWKEKITLIVPMLIYMVPLFMVYFFEYLINQTFHELLYFPNAFITHAEQYRWYQTIYQVGVFISRSSLCLFTFRYIWILAIIQAVNTVVLLLQIVYFYIPTIFVVFFIILFEGLIGGLGYVNTFHYILQLEKPEYSEYRMGVASVADSFGITLAGIISVPLHNFLCTSLT